MELVRLAAHDVAWPIAPGGAARDRETRSALIVEATAASGAIGYGEAAPLPGMSKDTLDDARCAIELLARRLPLGVAGELGALARLVADATPAPAARFAIETALVSALAAERGVAVAALLAGARPPAAAVPFAVVVDTPDEARAAVAAGARTLKIKVGTAAEDARVRAIAAAVPGARLRLDANRAWPRDGVVERLAGYAELPIDYVEEPCPRAHELLGEPLALPIALDESLAALAPGDLAAALRSPRLGALILKPTLLGLARCIELADLARRSGVAAIVGHALEGPIGTAACAELALALGGSTAVGLAPHAALAAWAVCVPQLAAAEVRATVAPGLGLDREAIAGAVQRLAPRARDALTLDPTDGAPAVDSALGTASFADSLRRPPPAALAVVAHPTLDTIAAIHGALAARRPIALLHPKLPAAELDRQRALVERARLDDAAVVLFTSGSTGASRGVVLGRAALLAAAEASAAQLGWRTGDRWLLALSLAHAGGLAVVVRCLAARRPVVLVEPGDSLAARLAGCTLASLVPTQLAALLDDPAWRPPPGLRAVLLGGAAAPPALLEAAAARGVPFLATYGMTESFGQLATAPLARAGDPGAPLVPLAGVTLAAGERDAPAPIRVRGAMLASRYLDGAPIAPELVTADLGYLDDGALRVVGRTDDVIVTGGENVHPQQIEAVLAATPGVRAACAFAISDPRWGQRVGAAIAVDARFTLAAAAARWHAELPPHARPRELAIAHALPVTPNGKLDRRAAAQLPREPVRYERA